MDTTDLGEVGTTVSAALAKQAFKDGFAFGADISRSRRHRLDALTHKYWRLGYEAGRKAAIEAVGAFLVAARIS